MIQLSTVKKYCNEDISLIENYDKAINDDTQTWHCHHRLETDLGLSVKQLKYNNLYYNRPAPELIFLTSSEHHRLHMTYYNLNYKDYSNNSFKGKHHSEESKEIIRIKNTGKKQSEKTKRKRSESLKKYYDNKENRLKLGNIMKEVYEKMDNDKKEKRGNKISAKLKGKKHSKEHCKNIGKTKIGNNYTKGRIWVNKEGLRKMVHPEELQKYLEDGWHRGRK